MQDFAFLEGSSIDAAKRLLGCHFIREINGEESEVRIVDTEAYSQDDMASHSYRGISKRNAAMFGPAGTLYVYFTYGMHYCMNIVCGQEGVGEAVLIRAVETIRGEDFLQAASMTRSGVSLTNGPAKLTQVLRIDASFNEHDLLKRPLRLIINPKLPDDAVADAPRIGISKAKDKLWRYYIRNNRYVSR